MFFPNVNINDDKYKKIHIINRKSQVVAIINNFGLAIVYVPWVTISGRGSHIKATHKELIIERGNNIRRYPLEKIGHLIVIGMHTLQTSTIVQLLRSGSSITFFDSDYTPLGSIYPYNYTANEDMRDIQKS
jgi:hypothetical protein